MYSRSNWWDTRQAIQRQNALSHEIGGSLTLNDLLYHSKMPYPRLVAWNGKIVLQQAFWYQTMPIMFGAHNFYDLNSGPICKLLALSNNSILNT